jgi:hypothetical protein
VTIDAVLGIGVGPGRRGIGDDPAAGYGVVSSWFWKIEGVEVGMMRTPLFKEININLS